MVGLGAGLFVGVLLLVLLVPSHEAVGHTQDGSDVRLFDVVDVLRAQHPDHLDVSGLRPEVAFTNIAEKVRDPFSFLSRKSGEMSIDFLHGAWRKRPLVARFRWGR